MEPAIWTSSARFRDELVRLALHAGCAAHFTTEYIAGEHRGVVDGTAIISNYASYKVCYPLSGMRSGHAEPILHVSRDISRVEYTGRTWCVTVPHGLIIVRRIKVNGKGVVEYASKPVIVGNCGGLGHRITACPKLEREKKAGGAKKDYLGAGGGEM